MNSGEGDTAEEIDSQQAPDNSDGTSDGTGDNTGGDNSDNTGDDDPAILSNPAASPMHSGEGEGGVSPLPRAASASGLL